jgi:hypothetical protein
MASQMTKYSSLVATDGTTICPPLPSLPSSSSSSSRRSRRRASSAAASSSPHDVGVDSVDRILEIRAIDQVL